MNLGIVRDQPEALHVGTYEAAIENVLRRIRDHRDDLTAFYLHRVAIRVGLNSVNDGYRDENVIRPHRPATVPAAMRGAGRAA